MLQTITRTFCIFNSNFKILQSLEQHIYFFLNTLAKHFSFHRICCIQICSLNPSNLPSLRRQNQSRASNKYSCFTSRPSNKGRLVYSPQFIITFCLSRSLTLNMFAHKLSIPYIHIYYREKELASFRLTEFSSSCIYFPIWRWTIWLARFRCFEKNIFILKVYFQDAKIILQRLLALIFSQVLFEFLQCSVRYSYCIWII